MEHILGLDRAEVLHPFGLVCYQLFGLAQLFPVLEDVAEKAFLLALITIIYRITIEFLLAFGAVLFALSTTACGEDEKTDSAEEEATEE